MRSAVISDWLAGSDWATWSRNPVAGDASARRYERLAGPNGESAILMDAPPETCGSQQKFVEIAAHLRGLSLAAPEVFAWDEALGLMVLEDLGSQDFAKHLIAKPSDERRLYEEAVDMLLILGSAPAPHGLQIMTPLVGAEMVGLAFEWAAKDRSADLQQEITQHLTALLAQVSPEPVTLSLRDFHAENLIWRPDQTGTARVGLLDFQDAFVTHPAYDLASLLRDARRDVDPALTPILLNRMGGGEDMMVAFHVMAVQRNLRILGIFQRLAQRDNKTKYQTFIPRLKAHLRTDLSAPALQDLAPLVDRAFDLKSDAA